MALKIGLDVADALRLAAEVVGRMQQRVVIELDERLKRDIEALAIIEQRPMVIGNPPWAGIEIKTLLELAGLRRAAGFRNTVAAPQGPGTPTRPAVELQYLDLVAGLAQFERRGHSRKSRTEDQDRCAPGIAVELDRPLVSGLSREAEAGHGVIHRSTAGDRADQRQQIAPGEGFLPRRFCFAIGTSPTHGVVLRLPTSSEVARRAF